MRYDAVLFDNDGILTTPTRRPALTAAAQRAFQQVGVESPTDEQVEAILRPTVETLERVARAVDVSPERLWTARERAATAAQRREIEAGRKRLYDDVSALGSIGLPRAIVSNNQQATIDTIVSHFGLDRFDPHYGREPTVAGIRRKKPTPYYLERAIEEIGASNPLYVGDSQVDVVAADALGVDSVFVRRPHRSGYDLDPTPTHVIEGLGDLETVLG